MSRYISRYRDLVCSLTAVISILLILQGNTMGVELRKDLPGVTLLLSADTEGYVYPCEDCNRDDPLGGFSRRATVIKRIRHQTTALLIDAGNTFFGVDSMNSQGKVIVDGYNAMGYDVVNLSYRDFRLGEKTTIDLLKDAQFDVLSANLLDAESNKLIAKPFVVKLAGQKRVAFVGITQSPAGWAYLHHLKQQLAGLRIRQPLEALKEWLPKASESSDRTILVYYGSAVALRQILKEFGAELAAVIVGGIRPSQLPSAAAPPLFGSSAFGQTLNEVQFALSGDRSDTHSREILLDRQIKADADAEALLAVFGFQKSQSSLEKSEEKASPKAGVEKPKKANESRFVKKKKDRPSDKKREDILHSTPSIKEKSTDSYPTAKVIDDFEAPKGLNIALAALGGNIESVTSQQNYTNWAVRNLIDGFSIIRSRDGSQISSGWTSTENELPEEIVFSFYQGREASINALILDTIELVYSDEGQSDRDKIIPKHVEVWTSMNNSNDGFSKVAGFKLHPVAAKQLLTFPTTQARYVKLKILSNYGHRQTGLAEVGIIEDPESGKSILADLPKNLALPALGGSLVWFTSHQSKGNPASQLIDGLASKESGWMSEYGPYGSAAHLPQEFLFAFKDNQTAYIDRVTLTPLSGPKWGAGDFSNFYPKLVSVYIANKDLVKGYEEIGKIKLERAIGKVSIPVQRKARYVKLKILENHGGEGTSLGEVEIIEGSREGYTSILLASSSKPSAPVGTDRKTEKDFGSIGYVNETEANNSAEQANTLKLDQYVRGTIDPQGDSDYYEIKIPETDSRLMNVSLTGWPNIRTALNLSDSRGKETNRFSPEDALTRNKIFSWSINPGNYFLNVYEPPASTILIWDSSGSMSSSINDVRKAVIAYIDQITERERINVIRFGDKPEVLLPAFNNNKTEIRKIIEDKFTTTGGTSLYDAVAKGIFLLKDVEGARSLIVLSDGVDTRSKLQTPEFWHLIKKSHIRIYTIGMGWDMKNFSLETGSTGKQMVETMAMATDGRFFYAPNSRDLSNIYQRISEELGSIPTYYLKASLSKGYGSLSVISTGEKIPKVSVPKLELILDASGSMRERKNKINGKLKIDVAKEVLKELISKLPDEMEVALRVYGHRIREERQGDCLDSELVVPFGKQNRQKLLKSVHKIKALGTTPLGYSLRKAAEDFGQEPGEKLIVVITDGNEECGLKPKEVVLELLEKGIEPRINVVGFALSNKDLKDEMGRVADMSGGRFYDAQDQKGLQKALKKALAVPFSVKDVEGITVAKGLVDNESVKTPEGMYTVTVEAKGGVLTIPDVQVQNNQSIRIELKKEGQGIGTNIAVLEKKDGK